MKDVQFVDQTLRDGQQSLWGWRMQARHMLRAAREIDRVGYWVVDYGSSSQFEIMVRYCQENPWDTLDLVHEALPNNTLRAGVRSNAIVGFSVTPNALLELWIRTLVRHGIQSFWIVDCLFNLDQMEWMSNVIVEAGATPVPAILFGATPIHTDEFFSDVARKMAAFRGVESIYFEDAAGILRPERAHTLVPALVDAIGDLPLEFQMHNTTGMAPLNYLIGVEAGARILHTASRPLANGPSLPSVEAMIENLAHRGFGHTLNEGVLPRVAAELEHVRKLEGFAESHPSEYLEHHYWHQLPGGMTGTLKKQLEQYGMSGRLDEVLEETVRIRGEVGHPVPATPFSQIVGIQAVLNVVTGERYRTVSDEMIVYAKGHLGDPPVPFDPDVMDAIMSSPRAKEYEDWEPPQPTLKELRREYGETLSDEELLLRAVIPGEDVDAMLAAGPVVTDYPPAGSGGAAIARHLIETSSANFLHIKQPGLDLTLRRHPSRKAGN